ncbi:hypothetical protein V8C37DRAFT_382742, partial [Trichoderma ceciliae]
SLDKYFAQIPVYAAVLALLGMRTWGEDGLKSGISELFNAYNWEWVCSSFILTQQASHVVSEGSLSRSKGSAFPLLNADAS